MNRFSKDPHPSGGASLRASLELLYEIGREVSADLDLRTLLHRVLFLSMKNVRASSGSIIVLDESGQPGESAFLIHGKTHDHTALQLRVTYESGMAGWVARKRQAALIADTSKDSRWLRRPDDAEDRTGPKSAMSAPILAHEKLVGVITLVHPSPGFFTNEHLDLLQAIAGWAGSAILQAQLYEKLQAAHRRYRELFEDSIDMIFITDMKGKILETNRRAEMVVGLGTDDMYSVNITQLHQIDAEKIGTSFEKLEPGETISYESVLHSYVGRNIPVQVYIRNIHYAGESNLQWIVRDITERKDLDSLREDLIAMVYHDLRSPLSNIVSSLEVLSTLLPVDRESTTTSLLNIAQRSTERIQRLTDSLLDINRLEAGQTVGNRQPVDLNPLVKDVLECELPFAESKNITVTVNIPSPIPKLFADADMLRRVLINLLENAVKFTPSGGQVTVSAQGYSDQVEVCIQDNGSGIPAADHVRIFEKFTRLSTGDGPRGLGLGLAYCRLAVASHGGQIWVESEVDKGSSFKFTIPVAN
jgi:NtrC-family two-component system sensor histidine kinase KinB